MKVSIIILNYNGKQYLMDCLSSIRKQTFQDFEIILFDNGSTDYSFENNIPPDLEVFKLIRSKTNLGFAEGNNWAILHAEGEYVVLLNNDTIVDEHWLEELVKVMDSSENIAVATSKILRLKSHGGYTYLTYIIESAGLIFDDGIFPRLRGSGEHDHGQYDTQCYVWGASGCSMMIRKSVIDKLGLFDSSYFAYCEDVDFCWRVNEAGLKIVYNPNSIVYHYGGGTSKQGFDVAMLIEHNKAKTIKKHGSFGLKCNFIISELIIMIKSEIGYICGKNKVGAYPYANAILELFKR